MTAVQRGVRSSPHSRAPALQAARRPLESGKRRREIHSFPKLSLLFAIAILSGCATPVPRHAILPAPSLTERVEIIKDRVQLPRVMGEGRYRVTAVKTNWIGAAPEKKETILAHMHVTTVGAGAQRIMIEVKKVGVRDFRLNEFQIVITYRPDDGSTNFEIQGTLFERLPEADRRLLREQLAQFGEAVGPLVGMLPGPFRSGDAVYYADMGKFSAFGVTGSGKYAAHLGGTTVCNGRPGFVIDTDMQFSTNRWRVVVRGWQTYDWRSEDCSVSETVTWIYSGDVMVQQVHERLELTRL
jgi:hypothetical protein